MKERVCVDAVMLSIGIKLSLILIILLCIPELIESAMYLYQATHDPYLIELAVDILEAIEHETKTKCGYATVCEANYHCLQNLYIK